MADEKFDEEEYLAKHKELVNQISTLEVLVEKESKKARKEFALAEKRFYRRLRLGTEESEEKMDKAELSRIIQDGIDQGELVEVEGGVS